MALTNLPTNKPVRVETYRLEFKVYIWSQQQKSNWRPKLKKTEQKNTESGGLKMC